MFTREFDSIVLDNQTEIPTMAYDHWQRAPFGSSRGKPAHDQRRAKKLRSFKRAKKHGQEKKGSRHIG